MPAQRKLPKANPVHLDWFAARLSDDEIMNASRQLSRSGLRDAPSTPLRHADAAEQRSVRLIQMNFESAAAIRPCADFQRFLSAAAKVHLIESHPGVRGAERRLPARVRVR